MTQEIGPPADSQSAAAANAKRQRNHSRLIRISAYSVATVLALLMTTATLPPILADQSDRAVINAPITLLTAPINGELRQMTGQVGQHMQPGEPVAHVENRRVDRTTLITLESKAEELQGALLAATEKKDADRQYIAALDAEILKQVDQTTRRLEAEIHEARARVAAAEAGGLAKKAVVDRQQSLVARNVASLDLVRPTQRQYEAARFEGEAEVAKLDQKIAQLNGVRSGIFVGNELSGLAILAQKRRDIAYDAQRMEIEETQITSSLAAQQSLLAAEKDRLENLTNAAIVAANGGSILSLGSTAGRHVKAGDAIATITDCDKAFVVAIFSYRKAQALAVGTRVSVTGATAGANRQGTISEILPKASDKTDEQYAVPFPQTERREMYVLVSLDPPEAAVPAADRRGDVQSDICSIGQWVTVTRANGWVPSASVAWRTVTDGLSGPRAAALWDATSSTVVGAAEATSRGVVRAVTSDEAKQVWLSVSSGAARTAEAVSTGFRKLASWIAPPKPNRDSGHNAAKPDDAAGAAC
ncbi:hypothetical protein FG93_04990 [Bosea sp. LC85]|uniref:HlyD family efflux transporter periplasmic adaptor subunit n=1 Tax=Bosea sp. LC85 TaxID=1502851 RepID=UPI0004E2DB12|nr:HlyD family efflux transporter periplasmic adaptor subunit [Bosea sp. LC85]KFC64968.1 hypothetical protein FG93_04990 [Bosea sp. LC85]